MTRKTVRIAMNGLTGRMGYRQHLVRSILALREQGGLALAVDTYHVWWDDRAPAQIARAGAAGRIHVFQLADWTVPLPAGVLNGRGQLGDGTIGMREWKGHVDAAGYTGPSKSSCSTRSYGPGTAGRSSRRRWSGS